MKVDNITRAAELLRVRAEIVRLRDQYIASTNDGVEMQNLSPMQGNYIYCDTQSRNGYHLSEAVSKAINYAARELLRNSPLTIANKAIERIDNELEEIKGKVTNETLQLLQSIKP